MFGAAVHAGGRASPTLVRRIDLAAELAVSHPDAPLFLSGAVGRYPPSEASVMAALLAERVDPDRLILDETSRDTLQTVQAAVDYARATGSTRCIACTDGYHRPRCRMLFRLFGMPGDDARFAVPRSHQMGYLWHMRLREAAAIPYDLVAGLAAVSRAKRRPR